MTWDPGDEEPWQYRLLDKLPPSIDLVQLERSLKMTPTERLEHVRRLGELAEALRAGRDRLSKAR